MEVKSLKRKVWLAIESGTFWAKVNNKLHCMPKQIKRVYYLKNNYVKETQEQVIAYQKLYKKYRQIIEIGVDNKVKRVRSNNVWFCWLQGIDTAPDIVKACLNSLRNNMSDSNIIILDEKNLSDYVKFPPHILEKKKNGVIGAAHFSDLIRIAVLCKYGGIWIDSTVLCTASSTDYALVKKEPLFVYKNVNLIPRTEQMIKASNWLIAADSNSPILLLTCKLLLQYWKDYNYTIDYYVFHLFFSMATKRYEDEWNRVPVFNNVSPHIMGKELELIYSNERWNQYLSMSSFHKLNHHKDYTVDCNTFYKYIVSKYLKCDEK